MMEHVQAPRTVQVAQLRTTEAGLVQIVPMSRVQGMIAPG
jgi:hypothetical protein